MNYKGIPKGLPEFLENAKVFEVWFFDPLLAVLHRENFRFKSEYIDFKANQVNKNVDREVKENLIKTFLKDVEIGGMVSRCWIPHHGIRAIYNDQLLEIAVCFECGWFRGQMLDKKFGETFPNENESESKLIFDKVIENGGLYES